MATQTAAPTCLPQIGQGHHGHHRQQQFELEVQAFVRWMRGIVENLGFSPGSRSWCYLLEDAHTITKGEFKKAEKWLADNRKRTGQDGLPLIPWDLIAKDETRKISGFDSYDKEETPREYINRLIRELTASARDYWPASYWKYQHYFPIIWVEKADLIKLFDPVLPDAVLRFSGKGWADLNSRADCLGRMAWARSQGLLPVILYCGDHDPDGLRISDTIRKNLADIKDAVRGEWIESRREAYLINGGDMASLERLADVYYAVDETHLQIIRFGLNEDFIEDNDLLWIDGLETSSGKYNLEDPQHRNHRLDYVQDYLKRYGPRKVEANALIVRPAAAQDLMEAILYGDDLISREGEERWNAENATASAEASECTDHFVKMLTIFDSQGWLYEGHKITAAAQAHRAKQQGQLPPTIDIDVH